MRLSFTPGLTRTRFVLAWVLTVLGTGPLAAQESGGASEQIISDPELEDLAPTPSAAPTTPSPASDAGTDAQARAVVHSRFGADLRREDPREEVLEGITIATIEATVRRSENLRFGLGLRARHRYGTLAQDVPDARAERHDLDALPTAGYVDYTPTPGLHLQVGYQSVHLGRFDVLSATNFLAAADLRDGPATLPESGEFGQIAARLDYDPVPWLSLRVVYLPFFTPHLVSLTESDYALFPATQADVDAGIDLAAGNDAMVARRLRRLAFQNLSRGDRERLARGAAQAFAPEPTLSEPQGAIRATAHGPAGEVGLTVGTALERLPAVRASPALLEHWDNPDSLEAQGYLAAESRPLTLEYNRFAVLSVDAATALGPVSLGVEAAYMLGRTLMSSSRSRMPQASASGLDVEAFPEPERTDLAHLGLRAEYLRGTEWLFALESFFTLALSDPRGRCIFPERGCEPATWLFFERGRYVSGAALLAGFAPGELGLRFELAAGVLTGPSFVFAPRVGYALLENLEIEVGALLIEGRGGGPGALAASRITLGGLYDTVDQVYLGARFQP